jgi:hypothetical protein
VSIDQVVWELFGGTGHDHHALWRAGCWRWDFAQTQIDGSPLSTLSQTRFGRPSGSDDCAGCGASLPASRICAYCDHLNGGSQGHTLFGSLAYTHHPIGLPGPGRFGLILELVEEVKIAMPLQIRFTLYGRYTNPIEIG